MAEHQNNEKTEVFVNLGNKFPYFVNIFRYDRSIKTPVKMKNYTIRSFNELMLYVVYVYLKKCDDIHKPYYKFEWCNHSEERLVAFIRFLSPNSFM